MLNRTKVTQIFAVSSLIFGAFSSSAIAAPQVQHTNSVAQKQTLITQVTDRYGQFQFDSRDCKRSDSRVICDVLVTNITAENLRLYFYANAGSSATTSVDSEGNQYSAKRVQIGEASGGFSKTNRFAPGIPVRVNFIFEIPESVNQLVALNVSHGNGITNFRFNSSNLTSTSSGICTCQK